ILSAGIILALMSVPVIVSVGEDSLKAVPESYREAALALGASRWEIVYRVLFPAAKNGLLAAVLLGVGRAVGETMAVLMATGHAVKIPTSLMDSVRTLTATIAAELGEAPVHSDHYQVLFIIGILLFSITFAVNLAAVFLNEYARETWFTRVINLAVVNLAGVPSIVHALFGLGAFVLFAGLGKSILAASLTLAIMTLPVIIASTKEALASVPLSFREACWNVGATRWQTIRGIVLPNSISGILTGVILQVSRAAGETAPIMFTGAVFFKNVEEGNLFAYSL